MADSVHLKYLAVTPQDLAWGVAVNSVGRQDILPGEPYPPSNHPSRYLFSEKRGRILNEYQLLFIAEGRGHFTSASLHERVPLHAGDMFLLFPGEWHSYRPEPQTGWTEYWIGFNGDNIERLVRNGFFTKERPVLHVGIQNEIVSMYKQAIQAALLQESGFQPLLGSIVILLLGSGFFYNRNVPFRISATAEQMNRAKLIIDEQFRTITPEQLADKVNMGYSNFRKVFKEYTGFAPAKYIQEVRFNKIKEALTNTMSPIKQIALEMGFENDDYFFTAFRRTTGMTPAEYRAMTQGLSVQR